MLSLQIPENTSLALYRRVALGICDAIRAGELEPGDELPPRGVLASQLGVSTTCLNDACQWLQKHGILSGQRGRGTRVQPEALRHLDQPGQRFDAIIVVAGVSHLAECDRELGYLYNQILAGVHDVMGPEPGRITFVPRLDRACMEQMPANSAVLLNDAQRQRADPAVVHELVHRGVPVVSIWSSPCRFELPHVWYDPRQAVDVGCRHLIECGYRRIGFIGNKGIGGDFWLGVKFLQFTNTLQEAGLDFRARDMRDVQGISRGLGRAYEAARDIAESGDLPEALFADTDYKAIEALHALQDAGVRVPEDIALVGCDGLPEAANVEPALTTVAVPRRQIGRRAAELLLQWQEQGAMPAPRGEAQHMFPSELIVRDTTPVARTIGDAQDGDSNVVTSR